MFFFYFVTNVMNGYVDILKYIKILRNIVYYVMQFLSFLFFWSTKNCNLSYENLFNDTRDL